MDEVSIQDAIRFLANNFKYLTEKDFSDLRELVGEQNRAIEDLDLLDEVKQQLILIKGLREQLMSGSRDKTNALNPKDYKDLVSTSTSLFSLLTKLHSEILSQDRVKKIEEATVEAIKSLSSERQETFFTRLAELLEEKVR